MFLQVVGKSPADLLFIFRAIFLTITGPSLAQQLFAWPLAQFPLTLAAPAPSFELVGSVFCLLGLINSNF